MHMDIDQKLSQWDLSGHDFSNQSLGTRDFSGKCLKAVNFSGAHLGCANFRGADLRGANLSYANLGAADLSGADLRNADLRGANLNATILDGADLRGCSGYEQDIPAMALPPYLSKNLDFVETDEYQRAKDSGFWPISYWGRQYQLNENSQQLSAVSPLWEEIKSHLGEMIFSDRETYREVLLVQQFKQYSQWAYMISQKGFERLATQLGLDITFRPELND
jgi:hypothetical protein